MNKNSRQYNKIAHKNARKGSNETTLNFPHTTGGSRAGSYTVKPRLFTIAKPDSKGVVSRNESRNMQMKIYFNKGEDKSRNVSTTAHEPIDRNRPFQAYKNSNYGKRPGTINVVEDEDNSKNFVKIPRKVAKSKEI